VLTFSEATKGMATALLNPEFDVMRTWAATWAVMYLDTGDPET